VPYTNGLQPIAESIRTLPAQNFYRIRGAANESGLSLSAPLQTASQILSEGFQLIVTSDGPGSLTIERTTDFQSWQEVGSIPYTNSPVSFLDDPAQLHLQRFYRLRCL